MNTQPKNPKFLNLLQIHMPIGAIASIAHRASGILLFLVLPAAIYLLDLSLRGPDDYARAVSWVTSAPVQLISVVFVWALAHHILTGIRFLLIDLELGVSRAAGRSSAWLVSTGSVLVAVIYLASLL